MIDGTILGVLTWLSFLLTFKHLPKIIKKILLKHPLFCDILATTICFLLLSSISKSILSVVGSIVCGLLINITLVIYNKRKTNDTNLTKNNFVFNKNN